MSVLQISVLQLPSGDILMSNPFADLFVGTTYPLRALAMLRHHPKLRGYVVMPIILNLLVGMTLYASLLFLGFRAIDALITELPQWTAHLSPAQIPNDWQFLPTWRLPAWTIHFPAWITLPTGFHLPHWTITLPDWLTAWTTRLPNWRNWHWQLPDWTANLPDWGLEFLVGLLRVVLTIALLLATGFVFLQFGGLLGAPWYGKLSEEIERIKTGQVTTIEVGLPRDISRAILYELKKLVITLGIGIALLLLNLFVGVGTAIASIGGISLAATIVCLDFLDSTLERRRLRFREKLRMIRASLPASASFGLVCLALVSVPLINLLAVPVCVMAGTLFACDRVLPQLPIRSSSDHLPRETAPNQP
jgi:CysZ protein